MAYTPYPYQSYGVYNPTPSFLPQNYSPVSAAPNPVPQNNTSGQTGYMCRPVTSRLEAEAVQVDFLGPGTIMPDLAHGVIYLKRFNTNTGASDFLVFAVQNTPETEPVQYATIEDINSLRSEIEALKKHGKAVKKNDPDE